MRESRAIGLIPPSPNRKPHPCNGMTAEVHLGDGAAASIVNPFKDSGVEWTLRYGDPDVVRFSAASLIDSYDFLLSGQITTSEAIRRLRVLRQARAALKDNQP